LSGQLDVQYDIFLRSNKMGLQEGQLQIAEIDSGQSSDCQGLAVLQ
jgi:hypothetical protein